MKLQEEAKKYSEEEKTKQKLVEKAAFPQGIVTLIRYLSWEKVFFCLDDLKNSKLSIIKDAVFPTFSKPFQTPLLIRDVFE